MALAERDALRRDGEAIALPATPFAGGVLLAINRMAPSIANQQRERADANDDADDDLDRAAHGITTATRRLQVSRV